MEQAMLGIGTIIFIFVIIRMFITKERHKETIARLNELKAAIARLEQAQQEQKNKEEARLQQAQQEQNDTEARFEEVPQEQTDTEVHFEEAPQEQIDTEAQIELVQQGQKETSAGVRPRKLDEKSGYSARRRGGPDRRYRPGRG